MPKTRLMDEAEIMEAIRCDQDVNAALDDYILALLTYDRASIAHLESVIDSQLSRYKVREIEIEECFDGDEDTGPEAA